MSATMEERGKYKRAANMLVDLRVMTEAEQEENRRQLAELLERVRQLETLMHRLINELQGDGR